jgi:DNA repair protein RadA/Sms
MKLNVKTQGLKHGTNIKDIKIPAVMRQRDKTGMAWVDEALGEGIMPSSVVMVTGTPGAGKTTLLLQLAASLTKQGHIVLYNTGEESVYQVALTAERLGLLESGFVIGQDTMLDDIFAHVETLQKANPKKRVYLICDSLQTIDDGKWADGTNSATPLRVAEALTDWAKRTFNVVFFIGQVDKAGKFLGKNGIKHAVDVHIHMFIDLAKRSETFGERLLEVQKNRFGLSGRTHIYGINKQGVYSKGDILGLISGGEDE